MRWDLIGNILILTTWTSATQTVLSDPYAPHISYSRSNANVIFNSIYSAARQWGSSFHHNGLSLIPVTVPEGTLLYHGSPSSSTPEVPEWLAFEIEHGEYFALKRLNRLNANCFGLRDQVEEFEDPPPFDPGYLHLYQANRPLRLLYFDGMSAATASPLGPTDMQEHMFLNTTYDSCCKSIWDFAKELCKTGAEWGVEGFVRMEAGFEVIKCDFSDGLDLISVKERPRRSTPEGHNERFIFGWMRAMALRYNGIDGSRIKVDFSSMVHAGYYSTNLSNPDPEFSHLPRLVSADPDQLARIKADAREVWVREASGTSARSLGSGMPDGVDWQGVVDMIKKRFSDRLQHLATQPAYELFQLELNTLLNTFIDYGTEKSFSFEESINDCASHYLRPVRISSDQDKLIYAAVEAVTHRICSTLLSVRADVLGQDRAKGAKSVDTSRGVSKIHELIRWLDWSEWKMCRPSCGYNEVCYIAVLPFGTEDLHYNPRCLNNSELQDLEGGEDNYWFGHI